MQTLAKTEVSKWPMHHKKAKHFVVEHEEAAETIAAITADKTFYSWKHTGVAMYWDIINEPYVIIRQCRHSDLKIPMVYLKSLGLNGNVQFKNAIVSLNPLP